MSNVIDWEWVRSLVPFRKRNLLRTIQDDFGKTGYERKSKAAKDWFMKNVQSLVDVNRWTLLKDENVIRVNQPYIGQMFMYFYDPKFKYTLPFYDRFPLIIMVDVAKGGFYGLNLHYLPPLIRAAFLDTLTSTMGDVTKTESRRLDITYGMLKGSAKLRFFKPCFKHYLTNHVHSKIVRVEPEDWETAIFLPTEQFKVTKESVWTNYSRKTYR